MAVAEPVLYDSRDLVTHALVVGMTGSGKTGLGIALIEEAAIDGVPAIVIDPKGDLTNLLLTFPSLDGARTSSPGSTARRPSAQGRRAQDFAADQASRWKKGLADWGQDGGAHRAAARRGRIHHLHAGQHGWPPRVRARVVRAAGDRRCGDRARTGADLGLEPAGAGRRRRRAAEEPRAHPAVGACSRLRGTRARARTSRGSFRRSSSRRWRGSASSMSTRSFRRRIASRSRCRSTRCWPRQASRSGPRAIRSMSPRFSGRRPGSPVSRSSRSRTSTTRQRMFFVAMLLNAVDRLDARAGRDEQPSRACSTWTRSSGSFRRSRTRRRRCRC